MKRILIYLLTLGLIFHMNAFASVVTDVPSWLEGTLCMSTVGTSSLKGEMPYDRYLVFFDFDYSNVDTLKIAGDDVMTRDYAPKGTPVISSLVQNSYGYDTGIYDAYEGKLYENANVVRFVEDTELQYALNYGILNGSNMETDVNIAIKKPEYCRTYLDAVFKILGTYDVDLGGIYYLGYGVSEESELEIQLIYQDLEQRIIYHHFPLDYRFSQWEYDISPDGKLAWGHRGEHKIYISDGENEYVVANNEMILPNVCWKNDTQLLYIQRSKPEGSHSFVYGIKVYDLNTRSTEALRDESGKEIVFNATPFTISIDRNNGFLAIYCLELGVGTYIQILNLNNGDAYCFFPWSNDYLEESYNIRSYGIGDSGVIFFEPTDIMELRLEWY